MKRIIGLMALFFTFMAPGFSLAADNQLGIYVSPKFTFGLTQMEGSKVHINSGGSDGSRSIGSKTDETIGGSIAFGYDFSKKFSLPVRAEIEYSLSSEAELRKTWDISGDSLKLSQTFQIQTLFLNAYWDINTGTIVTPYVGVGLGMGFIDTEGKAALNDVYSGSTGSKTVMNFTWNVGAGFGCDITDNWAIDIGYRFAGLGSVKTKSAYDAVADIGIYGKTNDLYQHQVSFGVRYTF